MPAIPGGYHNIVFVDTAGLLTAGVIDELY